jgi:hypothetical protein
MFVPSFATVTRDATTNFKAGGEPERGAGDGDSDAFGSAGSIAALVLLAAVLVGFVGFGAYKQQERRSLEAKHDSRSKLFVAPGATAQAVDEGRDGAMTTKHAGEAHNASMAPYRGAAAASPAAAVAHRPAGQAATIAATATTGRT